MNLATFRSRVSGAIGLDNTASSTEQGLIDGWVNDAVIQFLVETKCYTRTVAMALTADQGDYDMDADILSMKNLWIEGADGTNVPLKQVDASEIIGRRTLEQAANPTVRMFALDGANMLRLYPSPSSSSDVLHATYVPSPTALSASGDAPSASANGGIPAEFHIILEDYVKWKAAEYANDQASSGGQAYKASWAEGVMRAKGKMARKAGVVVGSARVGRGPRWTWPVSPGVDSGA